MSALPFIPHQHPHAPPSANDTFDPAEAGRVVASVVLAAPITQAIVQRANEGLVRLSLAPLSQRDNVVSTPEELAPLIPPRLRDALADLLLELAGDEPVRRRVALAYVTLWGRHANAPQPTNRPTDVSRAAPPNAVAARVARAVIGPLPSHQHAGAVPDMQAMQNQPTQQQQAAAAGYRGDGRALAAAPVVDPLRARIARVQAEMTAVIQAVNSVVIGKSGVVTRVVVAMAARGHVLLMDVPGVGKTLLCKSIAAALGASFGRVQLTPDLMPMDVTGATTYDAKAGQFVFRPGPVFTNILLADEINRATPKTQSALLEVMEERTVTVDGKTHRMADPFQVLATMNPFDHDGTYPLPAAQIDRFMMMLELGLPSIEDEVRVLDTHLAETHAAALAPVVSPSAFVEWQKTVPLVHASPDVKLAAVRYIDGLRRTLPSANALSPRATIAWVRAGQARAMLAGREFVTIEDLLDVAPDVLRHRLWISPPEIRDRLRALGGAG